MHGNIDKVRTSGVTKFNPEEAKRQDAKADAVIEFAKRVHDWPTLIDAVEAKIDDQEEFVSWWRKNVTPGHGAGRGKKNATSVLFLWQKPSATLA